jgi:hypothetical protein
VKHCKREGKGQQQSLVSVDVCSSISPFTHTDVPLPLSSLRALPVPLTLQPKVRRPKSTAMIPPSPDPSLPIPSMCSPSTGERGPRREGPSLSATLKPGFPVRKLAHSPSYLVKTAANRVNTAYTAAGRSKGGARNEHGREGQRKTTKFRETATKTGPSPPVDEPKETRLPLLQRCRHWCVASLRRTWRR